MRWQSMGKYCKAYLVKRLGEFDGWSENLQNLRKEKASQDAQQEPERASLTDDDFLYLQENYVVTDGIFLDENIIFDKVTPEWKEFCDNTLKFEIPDFQLSKPAE